MFENTKKLISKGCRSSRFQAIINQGNEATSELPENDEDPPCSPYLKDMISDLGGHIFPDTRVNLGETNPVDNFEMRNHLVHLVEVNESDAEGINLAKC